MSLLIYVSLMATDVRHDGLVVEALRGSFERIGVKRRGGLFGGGSFSGGPCNAAGGRNSEPFGVEGLVFWSAYDRRLTAPRKSSRLG